MDTRKFEVGMTVEDAERHSGKVVQYHRRTGMVRVRWHGGYASFENQDKLRIVE